MPQYQHSCKTLLNAYVHPQGGASRRPGSQFQAITKGNAQARLIPFVFNESESYIIEITESLMRAINTDSATITEITSTYTKASYEHDFHTTFSASEFNDIKYLQIGDLLYLYHPDKIAIVIARTALDTFEIRPFYAASESTATYYERFAFKVKNTDATKTMTWVAGAPDTVTSSFNFFDSSMEGTPLAIDDGAGGYG